MQRIFIVKYYKVCLIELIHGMPIKVVHKIYKICFLNNIAESWNHFFIIFICYQLLASIMNNDFLKNHCSFQSLKKI